jgi:hypothetical protein
MAGQPGVDRGGLVGAVVVADQVHVQALGDLGVDTGQELAELDRPVPTVRRGDHGAVGDVQRREEAGGAVADVVMGAPLGHPGHHRERRLAGTERLDLRLLIDAQHDPGLGWVDVEPDDVVDLRREQRVARQLERAGPVGLEDAFQIRPIVDFDSPEREAIFDRDQWVASFGVSSRVATTTASACSTLITGGRPGRGSSSRPSSRSATNRRRHLPTVASVTRNSPATSLFDSPSAHRSTIRDRSASACADFARRDHRTS